MERSVCRFKGSEEDVRFAYFGGAVWRFMLVHHSNPREFEEKGTALMKRRAGIEERTVTKRQIDGLTGNFLEYHRETIQELSILSPLDVRE